MILIGCVLAGLLGMVLFPEAFLHFNVTHINYTDNIISYAGSFFVTNSLYHGGIQIWDRYDQFPMGFFIANLSLYKLTNLLTAFFYILLSPYSHQPAHLFGTVASIFYIYPTIFLRVHGCYLLTRFFTQNRWLALVASVWGALVLSPHQITGLSNNITYSLIPHMMFFLLRFWQDLRLKDLFMFFVTLGLCAAMDIFSAGYLYQGLHFFLLTGSVWAIIFHRERIFVLFKSFDGTQRKILGQKILKGTGILVFVGSLAIPAVYLIKNQFPDIEMGLENSRFKNPLSIASYFQSPAAWAPQQDFLKLSLDPTVNEWSYSWIYLGGFSIFLIILGVLAAKDSRKFIFIFTALFLFLINSPRDSAGLNGLTHWINALTNPLKCFIRSFHAASVLQLPFILMPLWIWGLEAFLFQVRNKSKGIYKDLLGFRGALFVFLGIGVLILPKLASFASQLWCITVGFLFVFLFSKCLNAKFFGKNIAVYIVLLASLFVTDAFGMSVYVRNLWKTFLIQPGGLKARPDVGPVIMDYQNPRILPVRQYYSMTPFVDTDDYLFETDLNHPGMLFRYTNYLRHFQPIKNYLPRHKAFADWVNDPEIMFNYLSNASPSMMFLARKAIIDEGVNFQQVIGKGLQRDIAVVDGFQGKLLSTVPEDHPSLPSGILFEKITVPLDKIIINRQGEILQAAFPMPVDLPHYYASTFLTPDENLLRLYLVTGPKEVSKFKTAQGDLAGPMTFDVNNLRDGWVTLALPKDVSFKGAELDFIYPAVPKEGMVGIFKNNLDDLGFIYEAPSQGWLVMHQPFDHKWKLTVDGQSTVFYKTNKSFIGFPLSRGHHSILLRYWPDTPVRIFLGMAVMLQMVLLFWILFFSLKKIDRD